MGKQSITHKEYIRLKALGILGVVDIGQDPRVRANMYTFVNDIDEVKKERLEEYNTWYLGDSDRLKNFFTRANAVDYNTDPLYNENKKSYFWAVSSTETDIKRTHSGHPRNIVDTLVYVMGLPEVGHANKDVDKTLSKILKANKFNTLLNQKSRPLTLVEGWGAWKINWDERFSDYPILLYYRADKVDFIYSGNSLRAIIYKDFYQDKNGQMYVLYETRWLGYDEEKKETDLHIDKELYRMSENNDVITPCKLTDLPQLRDVVEHVQVSNFKRFLGAPSIFFADSSEEFYGRSIFTGKTDIFDDIDQCFSQGANSVRRSTVHEYFNTLYLETDAATGLPIMPHAFDRKYIQYRGMGGADGNATGLSPVQVVQPQINFSQYAAEEQNLLIHAISGLMSPATLGIDIAKKDNAASEREKEKVTIFTRTSMIREEQTTIEIIAQDLLVANELMHNDIDEPLTCTDYDVYVKYDEFADQSFESRLEVILTAWQSGFMSNEMAVDTLYGNNLSDDKKKKELKYIEEQKKAQQQIPNSDPTQQGDMGILGAENDYNTSREQVAIDDLKEDMGIPELTSTAPRDPKKDLAEIREQ